MVCDGPHRPLRLETRAVPDPGPGQLLLRVAACGVCRTDLHLVDGELPDRGHAVVPGHEIVGRVVAIGAAPPGHATAAGDGPVAAFAVGARVGVPWLGATCGHCRFCRSGRENLCGEARFTGYDLDGGYADYAVADAQSCVAIPEAYGDQEAAPLLCAGLIGHRALRMTGDARRIGLYGFGAAAHIVAQVAAAEGREIYAFTRPGDAAARALALALGARWAGDSTAASPEPLDAAILFAPVGSLVPVALRAVDRGGCVVCAGIHMSDIPSFPYADLWGERSLRSVANLTRRDARDFMAVAARHRIRTETQAYALERANEALSDLRAGRFAGAAVLRIGEAG
jgi:propanol-preferring alcohol dehydrogenase